MSSCTRCLLRLQFFALIFSVLGLVVVEAFFPSWQTLQTAEEAASRVQELARRKRQGNGPDS